MDKKTLLSILTGVAAGLVTIGIHDVVRAKNRTRDIEARLKAFNYMLNKINDGDYPDHDVDRMVQDYDYYVKLEHQFKS